MSYRSVPLKARITLLSLAGLASSIVIASVGYFALAAAGEAERFLAEDAVPSPVGVAAINDFTKSVRQTELSLLLGQSPQHVKSEEINLNRYLVGLDAQMAMYAKGIYNDTERGLYQTLVQLSGAHRAAVAVTLAGAKVGDSGINALRQAARTGAATLFNVLQAYNQKAVEDVHSSSVRANHTAL